MGWGGVNVMCVCVCVYLLMSAKFWTVLVQERSYLLGLVVSSINFVHSQWTRTCTHCPLGQWGCGRYSWSHSEGGIRVGAGWDLKHMGPCLHQGMTATIMLWAD